MFPMVSECLVVHITPYVITILVHKQGGIVFHATHRLT